MEQTIMQRRFSTNWTTLCYQHQELNSKAREICINNYCQAIKEQPLPQTEFKIQGQFRNPILPNEFQELKQDYLLRFLLKGVSEIKDFSVRNCNQTLIFKGRFRVRENYGEDFIFNLENWPLGVEKLNTFE